MARKKQPIKDMARVKKLRGQIAHFTEVRDANIKAGLELSAINDQKVINAYTRHLEIEIGGSEIVEEVEDKGNFCDFIEALPK